MGYKKDIEFQERVSLFDPTHILIMADLVAIIETPRIDRLCSLDKDDYKSMNGIILNYHLG